MSKDEAILHYKATMAIFKKWHADGIITDDELGQINLAIAEKYSLSFRSIYLEKDLLCREKRVIYSDAKGGHYGQKNNET